MLVVINKSMDWPIPGDSETYNGDHRSVIMDEASWPLKPQGGTWEKEFPFFSVIWTKLRLALSSSAGVVISKNSIFATRHKAPSRDWITNNCRLRENERCP